jgi:hypothetical protein
MGEEWEWDPFCKAGGRRAEAWRKDFSVEKYFWQVWDRDPSARLIENFFECTHDEKSPMSGQLL